MRKGERQICWGLDRLAKKEVARSKRLTQELALGDFSFTTKAVRGKPRRLVTRLQNAM